MTPPDLSITCGGHTSHLVPLRIGRPEACPSCGTQTVVDGPRQMCENPACPAQAFRTVQRWVKGRNILHLGDETLDRLMAIDGPVQSIPDLYDVTRDQMKSATGGYAMADKILAALEASRDCTPAQVIGNIGIPGIGEIEAGKVCDYLSARDLGDVLYAPVEAYIAAIGDVRGRKLNDGLIENARTIARLGCVLRCAAKAKAEGPCSGMTFTVTGPTEIPREKLIEIITAAGGTWKSSVTKTVTHLITNDTGSGTTKNREAAAKGVKIIDEPEALRRAGYLP